MSLIDVQALAAYYNKNIVFENLSFSIEKGDYIAIIGENGSGKTTLMKCILGFGINHTGKIVYNGFTKNEIGYLPQVTNFKTDFPANVSEVILSGFAGKNTFGLFYSKAQKSKALENLRLLEIDGLAKRSFKELSVGQRQRVLLCRALCAAKSVLLLDEPETALDTAAKSEFNRIITNLNENGLTVISISHDVENALKTAGKILHIGNDSFFFGDTHDYIIKTGAENV